MSGMAYELLVRAWRPMTVDEIIGGVRALCAVSLEADALHQTLTRDDRFTFDGLRYGLNRFNWTARPGDFAYLDSTLFS